MPENVDAKPHLSEILGERLISYGVHNGVAVYRYKGDENLSGIIFGTKTHLVTARHVAKLYQLPEFVAHTIKDIDIAYKVEPHPELDATLSYEDRMVIPNCEIITSRLEKPEEMVRVRGKLGPIWGVPTALMEFLPYDVKDYPLFVGGVSGSPIVVNNRVIGLITHSNFHLNASEPIVGALAFSGRAMKEDLESIGLIF